jgi:Ca2+-binding RTX toxin-like protein
VYAHTTFALGANVENLTLLPTAIADATGNSLDNIITGALGLHVLTGGAGSDTYFVHSDQTTVVELAGEGVDVVNTTRSIALGANVENLVLLGDGGHIDGVGNALDNNIVGNGSDNLLDGGAGADTLTGGGGNDTYVVDVSADVIVEAANAGVDTVQSYFSFELSENLENVTLLGAADLNGTGTSAANVLMGNSGSNVLTGRGGNDTYIVQNTTDSVVEIANEGVDTVQSHVTYTLADNVENITLLGDSNINATGNALSNVLTGNSAANVLAGAAGDDIYHVQNTDDVVLENAGDGVDHVLTSVSYTLGAHVENLALENTDASGLVLTGNDLANQLVGNFTNSTLIGGGGDDLLDGGSIP